MATIPPNALFSAFSFIGFILSTIPLCWHLQASNAGICMYLTWTSLGCLILFINSIVWDDNVINWVPVWCDITARFLVGSSIGIPASGLCIIRKLFRITRLSSLREDKDDKRRALLIDLAVGIGFPCLIMALQYIVQGHRFNIYEQIGCFPATYPTIQAFIVVTMWPVVIGIISAVLAVLTFRAAYYQKAMLDEYLRTSCDISADCYWRLMALCATEICCTVPCGVVAIVMDTINGQVQPYISWDNVHADFSRVAQFPTVVWQSNPVIAGGIELTRWLYILCALMSFGFFGLGEEARESYKHALWVAASPVKHLRGVIGSEADGTRSPSRTLGGNSSPGRSGITPVKSSGLSVFVKASPSNGLPQMTFASKSTHSLSSDHSQAMSMSDWQVAAGSRFSWQQSPITPNNLGLQSV